MQTELKARKVMAVLLVVSMLFAYSVFFDVESVSACLPSTTIEICGNEIKADVMETITYDWCIKKSVDQETVSLKQNESTNLKYALTAVRSVKSIDQKIAIDTYTRVHNKGRNQTQNLKVEAKIIYTKSTWENAKELLPWKTIGSGTLMGCKYNDYTFSHEFTPVDGAVAYKVLFRATITNFNGYPEGKPISVNREVTVKMQEKEVTYIDESATVTDGFTAKPAGFTISGGLNSKWVIKEADLTKDGDKMKATKNYNVTIANQSVTTAGTHSLTNKAELTENDSGEKRNSCATVKITTEKKGSIITACIPTAASFWNKGASYNWKIAKVASPTTITFDSDESNEKQITYTLTATRKVDQSSEEKGITGTVGVTNKGNEETKGLKIKVQLQAKVSGSFQDVSGAYDEITNVQVGAGKSEQYTFSIPYTGLAQGTDYRVVSTTTADNFEGTDKRESGTFTATPKLTTTDEEASVQDSMGSIAGFEITSEFTNVWSIKGTNLDNNGKATKTYKVKVKNVNAVDGKSYTLNNTATITEKDSGQQDTATAQVRITVPKTCITLSTGVSAVNDWKKVTEYDWTIEKVASPTTLTVNSDQTKEIDYTLTAKRNIDCAASSEEKAVSGKVRITNNGKEATKGLKINVQLQERGLLGIGNKDVGSVQTITPDEQLAAGATKEYAYKIIDDGLVAGKDYQVVATITATNLKDTATATSAKFEANPVIAITDEEATVEDDFIELDKVDGFTLVGGLEEDWKIAAGDLKDGKATKTYTVKVTNKEAEGGKEFTLKNEAIITEKDSGETHNAVEEVTLKTEFEATKLDADLTAVGFWNEGKIYDWTIKKVAKPDSLRFKSKSSKTGKQIEYTLTATRTLADEDNDYGVNGKITVENEGNVATENLEINLQVMYNKGDGWKDISGATEKIKPSSQIAAGAKKEYEYSIDFKPVKGADEYKVVAEVTITNYLGKKGKVAGIEEEDKFSFPKEPKKAEATDETAVVEDEFTKIPNGFRVSGGLKNDWEIREKDLEKSGTNKWVAEKTYTVTLYFESGSYNKTYQLVNTATLKECDSRKTRKAEEKVDISTKKSSSTTVNPPVDPPKPVEPPEEPIEVPKEPVEPYAPPAEPITPPVEPEPTLPNTGGSPAAFITFGMSLVAYGSWLRFKK